MSMTIRGTRLLKVTIVAGFGLGLLLLAETYLTYQYVAGHLVLDHLSGEASRYISLIEQRARMNPPRDNENLREMLIGLLAPKRLASRMRKTRQDQPAEAE